MAIDLSQLLGGKPFAVSCNLVFNRYGFKTPALADTGANGYVLINTTFAQRLSHFLSSPIRTLPLPITVGGFDGRSRQSASQYIVLHLHIDGRKQYNVPMVLLNTGHHDLILGRTWFDHLNIQLNPRRRQLVWPVDQHPTPDLVKIRWLHSKILVPKAIDPDHQADADRRDQALGQEDLSPFVGVVDRPLDSCVPQILKRKHGITLGMRSSEYWDRQNNLRAMNRALAGVSTRQPSVRRPKVIKPDLPPIDIAAIGAAGFRRNLQDVHSIVFSTSLYEIDYLLEKEIADKEDDL